MHVTHPIIFKFHPRIKNFNDLTGQRFGILTVLGYAGSDKRWNGQWYCECGCGNTTIVSTNALTSTHHSTKSCGCRIGGYKHGHCGRTAQAPEYGPWECMNHRCYNPKNSAFERYGGRGIKICARWRGENGFVNFLSDVGPRPSPKHSIDRYPDPDGNYEPGNCRWATAAEQNRNRQGNHKITFNDETLCITDWATKLEINVRTVKYRIQNWGLERALTTPRLSRIPSF